MTQLDLSTWPYASSSQFLETRRYKWHYQLAGAGAPVLLIHGTGASTHSWNPVRDALRGQVQTCTVDLPGHGFSQKKYAAPSTYENITLDLMAVLKALSFAPAVIIGHSAGAVIAAALAQNMPKTHVIAVNAAFGQFPGLLGAFFSAMAQALTFSSVPARLLARRAQNKVHVDRLLKDTGSSLSQTQINGYHRLFQDPDHVAGALRLMSDWNISGFLRELKQFTNPTTFICGGNDRAVSPDVSQKWAKKLPSAELVMVKEKGHLLHEEVPEVVLETLSNVMPEFTYCVSETT